MNCLNCVAELRKSRKWPLLFTIWVHIQLSITLLHQSKGIKAAEATNLLPQMEFFLNPPD